jgi:GNAT superfamily N-acetyltransferase
MVDSTEFNIKVRPVKETDLIDIEKILRQLQWFDTVNKETAEKIINRINNYLQICQRNPDHEIYVAEKSKKVIGYVFVHWLIYLFLPGPEGYISDLFVQEKDRGHGVGSALLNEVKKQAEKRGCYRLNLLNNRERVSYKRGFYKKNGWNERENMSNFIFLLK